MDKLFELNIKHDIGKTNSLVWKLISLGFILELLFLYIFFANLQLKKSSNTLNTKNKIIVDVNSTKKYPVKNDFWVEKIVSPTASTSHVVLDPTITLLPTLLPTISPTFSPATYIEKSILTDRGQFGVKMITIDTSNGVKMITDSTFDNNCGNNCSALSLEKYVKRNNGFAGINGTYFCPPDYPECKDKKNSFDFLMYNSRSGKWLNRNDRFVYGCPVFSAETDGIKFSKDPYSFINRISDLHLINPYYSVYAAIFHCLKLVEDGKIVVESTKLAAKEKARNTKSGIGQNGKVMYLIVASNVSMEDFASVFKSLNVQNAFALDGGGSSALWYEEYKEGPGRNIPNAIIFAYDQNPYPIISPVYVNTISQNNLYLLKDSFENDLLKNGYRESDAPAIIPSPVSIYLKLPNNMKITEVTHPRVLPFVIGLSDDKLRTIYSQNVVIAQNNQYIITVNAIIADESGQRTYQDGCSFNNSGVSCFYKTFQESNFVVSQEIFKSGGYSYDANGKFSINFSLVVKKHLIEVSLVKTNPNKYFSDDEIRMWIDLFSHADVGPIVKN